MKTSTLFKVFILVLITLCHGHAQSEKIVESPLLKEIEYKKALFYNRKAPSDKTLLVRKKPSRTVTPANKPVLGVSDEDKNDKINVIYVPTPSEKGKPTKTTPLMVSHSPNKNRKSTNAKDLQQTPASDRVFFPPYKFPFWGMPYGIYSNAGFINPGLFPFVPGGPGFPPYDGIFGGPFGPGSFPGPGLNPFAPGTGTPMGLPQPAMVPPGGGVPPAMPGVGSSPGAPAAVGAAGAPGASAAKSIVVGQPPLNPSGPPPGAYSPGSPVAYRKPAERPSSAKAPTKSKPKPRYRPRTTPAPETTAGCGHKHYGHPAEDYEYLPPPPSPSPAYSYAHGKKPKATSSPRPYPSRNKPRTRPPKYHTTEYPDHHHHHYHDHVSSVKPQYKAEPDDSYEEEYEPPPTPKPKYKSYTSPPPTPASYDPPAPEYIPPPPPTPPSYDPPAPEYIPHPTSKPYYEPPVPPYEPPKQYEAPITPAPYIAKPQYEPPSTTPAPLYVGHQSAAPPPYTPAPPAYTQPPPAPCPLAETKYVPPTTVAPYTYPQPTPAYQPAPQAAPPSAVSPPVAYAPAPFEILYQNVPSTEAPYIPPPPTQEAPKVYHFPKENKGPPTMSPIVLMYHPMPPKSQQRDYQSSQDLDVSSPQFSASEKYEEYDYPPTHEHSRPSPQYPHRHRIKTTEKPCKLKQRVKSRPNKLFPFEYKMPPTTYPPTTPPPRSKKPCPYKIAAELALHQQRLNSYMSETTSTTPPPTTSTVTTTTPIPSTTTATTTLPTTPIVTSPAITYHISPAPAPTESFNVLPSSQYIPHNSVLYKPDPQNIVHTPTSVTVPLPFPFVMDHNGVLQPQNSSISSNSQITYKLDMDQDLMSRINTPLVINHPSENQYHHKSLYDQISRSGNPVVLGGHFATPVDTLTTAASSTPQVILVDNSRKSIHSVPETPTVILPSGVFQQPSVVLLNSDAYDYSTSELSSPVTLSYIEPELKSSSSLSNYRYVISDPPTPSKGQRNRVKTRRKPANKENKGFVIIDKDELEELQKSTWTTSSSDEYLDRKVSPPSVHIRVHQSFEDDDDDDEDYDIQKSNSRHQHRKKVHASAPMSATSYTDTTDTIAEGSNSFSQIFAMNNENIRRIPSSSSNRRRSSISKRVSKTPSKTLTFDTYLGSTEDNK